MEVEVIEKDTFSILRITGEISLYDIDLIVKAVASICQSGRYNIIVDLKNVPFMDSSGIGVFMQTIVRLSKNNGVLYFIQCAKRVQSLLNFSIENTNSRIFDTEEDAVIELNKRENLKSEK